MAPLPSARCSALRDYGHYLGMGFQIIDDVLDFEGEEEVLGKPVGSDLREGIVTLPALYYLRAHPEDGRIAAAVRDGADDEMVRDGGLCRLPVGGYRAGHGTGAGVRRQEPGCTRRAARRGAPQHHARPGRVHDLATEVA